MAVLLYASRPCQAFWFLLEVTFIRHEVHEVRTVKLASMVNL